MPVRVLRRRLLRLLSGTASFGYPSNIDVSTLFSDLRVGLRLLWKDKAFTATAGLTLAVCIGANTALFSVVRGVLLKPLGMPDADRVVTAGNMYPGAGVHEPIGSAVPDYFDRLREVTVFDEQAMIRGVIAAWTRTARP